MKILRIIARLNVGGPARHVVWLTKELQSDEFESVLIAGSIPEGEADMSYFAAENGVEPIYIDELSREMSVRDLTALRKIYRQIKLTKPDIIHTHTAKAGTVGRQAALLYRWLTWRTLIGRPRKVRVVHTFHGHVFHSYYGKLKTLFFLNVERVLARMATHRIVVISDQQLHEINKRFRIGRAHQFRVVPLGIDLGIYADSGPARGELRNEIGAADGELIVGFVGRLTEIKNIPLLLEAAACYVATPGPDKPKLKFVVVGEGHLRGELEGQAGVLDLDNTVTFLGHRADIVRLVAGMDIVGLTSRNEGTPLSLIEAMAIGIPVISTAVGGVVDLMGKPKETFDEFQVCERGVTVESGAAESFCTGLIYLAKNEKLRERLAAEGKLFVTAHYSKSRLIGDIKQLYRELMAL